MAMSILNNTSAQMTLGELNRNTNRVGKSLKKVANGQKINGATDDASQYGVSERMRELLRGLDQAGNNIQTDAAMLKTAEGATSRTLEILRSLKEKAIEAANDHNTDEDRAMIQKEVDQLIDQVNDNALVTFNGKYLLDGSSSPTYFSSTTAKDSIIRGLQSAWIRDSLDMIKETYGIGFDTTDATVHSMKVYLDDEGEDGTLAYVTHTVDSEGKADSLELHVNMQYYDTIRKLDPNGSSADPSAGFLDRTIVHEMTHAAMAANIDYFSELPGWVKEGGSAELVHGVDDTRDLSDTDDDYSGGFVKMRYMAHHSSLEPREFIKTFMKCLTDTSGRSAGLDYAIRTATHGCFSGLEDFEAKFADDLSTYGDNFLSLKCGINQENADTGAITGFDAGDGPSKDKFNTVREASRPVNWRLPTSDSTLINGLEVIWPKGYVAGPGGSLTFQVGARANESINVGLFNLTAQYIGLTDENGKNISVRTQKDANEMINHISRVIEVVLDQQTMLGAVQARLEHTALNVRASTDNTQAAESTIRDADMAKEMTELNKSQVLQQSSQAMLMKANQNMQYGLRAVTQQGTDTIEEPEDTTETKGALDENLSAVGKELQKITQGQKITSAQDDASSYSISEQMRAEIRGLEQDVENVQNGSALLKTALGGIQNIVDELRELKELAIDAANDSNTDEDRRVMQKVLEQKRANIDFIANTTSYNGKLLIDGTFARHYLPKKMDVVFVVDTTGSMGGPIESMASNLAMFANRLTSQKIDWRFGLVKYDDIIPTEGPLIEVAKEEFESGDFTQDVEEFKRALNNIRVYGGGDYPESGYDAIMDDSNGVMSFDFRAGVSKQIIILSDAPVHDSEDTYNAGDYSAADVITALKEQGITARAVIYGDEPDWTRITEGTGGTHYDLSGDYGAQLSALASDLMMDDVVDASGSKTFTVHHGTDARFATNFFIESMGVGRLGIHLADVSNRTNALEAIGIIEAALQYSLDNATEVGAAVNRLDYTKANVETERDNVQAADSTIRDADMAKEITKYARDNVLAQAAQSMLAQSINNPKLVMSLL